MSAVFINGFKNFLYASSTPTKVLVGLFLALPVHFAAPVILAHLLSDANLYLKPILAEQSNSQLLEQKVEAPQQSNQAAKSKLSQYDFNEASALLLLSAIAGSTGSVVSILTRIDQYQNEKYRDTLLPVFIGGFKPMIGAFFGILVFALVNSTLLPITITKDETKPATKWFALLSLSFVVGFSERFAKDIVSQTEGSIILGNSSSQALIQSVDITSSSNNISAQDSDSKGDE